MGSPHTEPPRDDAPQLARRLVAQELVGASGNEAAMVSRLVERVYLGLSRWFGPYGALALMTRAIARARSDHPLLAGVVASATTTPTVTGWPNGSTTESAAALADAAVALISTLHASLARLIGDDLAETLIAQSDTAQSDTAQSDAAPSPVPTEMPVFPNLSDA